MSRTKTEPKQVPAIEGWFTWPPSNEPHLIGSRCKACGDYFFPSVHICGNPNCLSSDVESVNLSRKGKLYTYTINYYKPPNPYVSPDPFVPFAIAVVALEKEKMKVQGMIASSCDVSKLKVGIEMELIIESLYRDKEGIELLVWKFKPV